MILKYQTWIKKNYPDRVSAYGQCKEATEKMVSEFPELKRKSGQIFVLGYDYDVLHWWCEDPEGNIVDPTIIQYSGGGYAVTGYEEYPEDHVARHNERAKCMECGQYFYRVDEVKKFSPCCSDFCLTAFARSFD